MEGGECLCLCLCVCVSDFDKSLIPTSSSPSSPSSLRFLQPHRHTPTPSASRTDTQCWAILQFKGCLIAPEHLLAEAHECNVQVWWWVGGFWTAAGAMKGGMDWHQSGGTGWEQRHDEDRWKGEAARQRRTTSRRTCTHPEPLPPLPPPPQKKHFPSLFPPPPKIAPQSQRKSVQYEADISQVSKNNNHPPPLQPPPTPHPTSPALPCLEWQLLPAYAS